MPRYHAGLFLTWLWLCLAAWVGTLNAAPATLEQMLLAEPVKDLAAEALRKGDPQRGALLFYRPQLNCIKCHAAGDGENPLGPDLARFEEPVTVEHLVESVLAPSRKIRKGYQPLVIQLDDGTALTGLLVEENARALIVRDAGQNGVRREIPLERIEAREFSTQSIMPTGQINLLAGRHQFLDLIAYLVEISRHGPARAAELKPPESLYAPPPKAPDTSTAEVQVFRTMMPESGPASLAIKLAEQNWVCFDPQRGAINYAWLGSLDLSPTLMQKINLPAQVVGQLYYQDSVTGPWRIGQRDHVPKLRFGGYRFEGQSVVLHYRLDELAFREQLTALPDGRGFVRQIEWDGPQQPMWLMGQPPESAHVDVVTAEREGDGWRIDAGVRRVRITIAPRGQKP